MDIDDPIATLQSLNASKERVPRLGRVLMHAAECGPQHGADLAEEMMRIATELTDNDVKVLSGVSQLAEAYSRLPASALHTLGLPLVQGIPPESVLGICAKLQSLGLIATAEQHARALGQVGYAPGGGFVPLERGASFLKFIAVCDER